jgi:uncharacterized small protein (DUF1192 family)
MDERRTPASLVPPDGVTIGHRRWSAATSRPTVRVVRRFLSAAVVALALALLVGCTGTPGTESSSADGAGGDAVAPVPAVPGGPEFVPGDPLDPDSDRQVVTTASASLEVEEPTEAAQRVSELVEDVGGRVEERTEQAGSGDDDAEGAVADLVVRVPASALTGVLADLEDLGDVENVSVSHSDVTTTVVDLDARISALQTSVARLQALMEGATDTEALLAAEKALSERQEQLESLQSRRAMLADQVELSTLSVHLAPSGVAPAGGPDGFLDGLATGWRSLVSALGTVVVVLGVLLPWLAVVALVAAAILVPVRLARQRRVAAVAPAPPVPPQD